MDEPFTADDVALIFADAEEEKMWVKKMGEWQAVMCQFAENGAALSKQIEELQKMKIELGHQLQQWDEGRKSLVSLIEEKRAADRVLLDRK